MFVPLQAQVALAGAVAIAIWAEIIGCISVFSTCRSVRDVQHERWFSALNRLMDRLRNQLKAYHLNVVLVLHDQKDKLLAPYSPVIVEFVKRWMSGERPEKQATEGDAARASGAGAAVDVAEGDRTDAATSRARGARASQEDWDPIVHGGQYADGNVARFLYS